MEGIAGHCSMSLASSRLVTLISYAVTTPQFISPRQATPLSSKIPVIKNQHHSEHTQNQTRHPFKSAPPSGFPMLPNTVIQTVAQAKENWESSLYAPSSYISRELENSISFNSPVSVPFSQLPQPPSPPDVRITHLHGSLPSDSPRFNTSSSQYPNNDISKPQNMTIGNSHWKLFNGTSCPERKSRTG